jgi:glycogen debranching enzyme
MTAAREKLTETARREALRVVRGCGRKGGMLASATIPGYPQVWARDSMITLLGAVLAGATEIDRSLEASVKLLVQNQTPLGLIPNNVHIRTLKPNFQAYADGGLWLVIGIAAYFRATGDRAFLKRYFPAVKKTLRWYEHQDVDQTGLVTMTEGSDWQDLFATRGKGLTVNLLHYLALKKAAALAGELGEAEGAEQYRARAAKLKRRINRHFWYGGDPNSLLRHLEPSMSTETFSREGFDSLGREHAVPEKRILKDESYYLPYLTFRGFGEWFDSLGNLLAILSGAAGRERSGKILDLIRRRKVDRPGPVKAIDPPIRPGDPDWRYFYVFDNLNLPRRYHNGGVWPFIGGFYVAALVKMKRLKEAGVALESLARLNRKGREREWEFNEWLEGETGQPLGMAGQAWSAGMYLYADRAVQKRKLPFF